MKNMELASKIIQDLVDNGVQEFVLCAGARNSPFVQVFAENPQLKVYHFFEERSAGFFALGRMAMTRKPVAICTTSGTATAELLPAAIEATYSSLPLIMLTADRPKRFRGSGAPQSIEQVGIFSYYIEVALDVDAENSHFSFKNLSWKKPIQLNVSFDEPLIDGEALKVKLSERSDWTKLPEQLPMNTLRDIHAFLDSHKPLIVVGFVPLKAHKTLIAFLKQYPFPVYLEGISSLRGHPELKNSEIVGGEKMVEAYLQSGTCNALLRLGGIPTLRLWRDLEEKWKDLPVLSLSYNHFTGLSREVLHFNCMEALSQVHLKESQVLSQALMEKALNLQKSLEALMEKYPQSEPSLIGKLSQGLKGQSVYLGNSLPIREWDLVADRAFSPARLVGNRGVNGIDGQISSFLGWAREDSENWALLGDLTTLYDLAAPWIVPQLSPKLKLRLVIINNSGGQIFKRMFSHPSYVNSHNLNFSSFASLWGWEYSRWSEIPQSLESSSERWMIELTPDAEQTALFWKEWELQNQSLM